MNIASVRGHITELYGRQMYDVSPMLPNYFFRWGVMGEKLVANCFFRWGVMGKKMSLGMCVGLADRHRYPPPLPLYGLIRGVPSGYRDSPVPHPVANVYPVGDWHGLCIPDYGFVTGAFLLGVSITICHTSSVNDMGINRKAPTLFTGPGPQHE